MEKVLVVRNGITKSIDRKKLTGWIRNGYKEVKAKKPKAPKK